MTYKSERVNAQFALNTASLEISSGPLVGQVFRSPSGAAKAVSSTRTPLPMEATGGSPGSWLQLGNRCKASAIGRDGQAYSNKQTTGSSSSPPEPSLRYVVPA
jgi:hypothetical protein